MASFSTRAVILCGEGRRKKKYAYEERITIWNAKSEGAAVRKAEAEAKRYSQGSGGRYLGFIQSYWLFEEVSLDGVEVFSLIRESDLPPKKYIDAYFDTGDEKQRK
ncbi:MAG: hypothetical protein QM691_07590 [Opitutaceae bacterium]